jgi:hypothetical protein
MFRKAAQYIWLWYCQVLVPLLLGDQEPLPITHKQATAGTTAQAFKSTSSKLRRCDRTAQVRRCLVAAVLVVLVGWLLLDILFFDGLVPGTKETYKIESKPLYENRKPVVSWQHNGTGNTRCSCVCTYNSSRHNAGKWGPPYVKLIPKQDFDSAAIARAL